MRNLEINKKQHFVLNYKGKEEITDSKGYKTGESRIVYSKAISFKAHISGAMGSTYVDSNGITIVYDKSFVLTLWEYKQLKITENSVFFIDTKPHYDANNQPLYDYKVERIRDTLNEVVILLKKVRNN